EQGEGGGEVGRGRERVDELARALAVGEAELGAPLLHRQRAVILGVARPSGEDLGVLGHPGAIVVFDLVIDGHAVSPSPNLYHFPRVEGSGGGRGGQAAAHWRLLESRLSLVHES